MPLAEDYDAAAEALDAAALATGTLIEPPRAAIGPNVMVGGQLTSMVTDELDAAAVILEQVVTELTQLAATCRERAETCRTALVEQQAYAASYAAYEADLRDWQEASDSHDGAPGAGYPGPPPEAPPPPPSAPPWANN
jgi:hypothetical protein